MLMCFYNNYSVKKTKLQEIFRKGLFTLFSMHAKQKYETLFWVYKFAQQRTKKHVSQALNSTLYNWANFTKTSPDSFIYH